MPIAFITAKAGKNVHATLNLAQNLHKQACQRVTTGDLNRVLRQALEATPPPLRQNRRPKIYYASQVVRQSADDRAVHQRAGVVRQHLPALSHQDVPRPAGLFRRADQAVPAQRVREDQQPFPEKPDDERPIRGTGRKGKQLARKPKVDVSKLPFKTKVTEEETRRDGNPYESELWTDL